VIDVQWFRCFSPGGPEQLEQCLYTLLFGDFSFPILVIIGTHISYSGFPPILLFQLFRGGVNQLNINQLGPEQSLFHIVPHCSGPPMKNIQTINNQSLRAGTMWNNVEQ
jgi:hypothetical protein